LEPDVSDVCVLVANEPRIYREVISAAFEHLRPSVEVVTAEAQHLNQEYLRLLPRLVVCSRLTKLVENNAPVWVELYPNSTPRAVVGGLGREPSTLAGMDFDTLLSILDNVKPQHGLE